MSRQLKKKILDILKQEDFNAALESVCQYPARQVINPLFSFFYHQDETIKWRAVSAMGMLVSELAEHDMESARVIMRRLMWNLNDESGGIGWGSPEAMGEIMARHAQLAKEFHRILISYIREDGNFIEHEMLQRGVLWGVGRLAQARPGLVSDALPFLEPYMASKDPNLRGLAAWAANAGGMDATMFPLKSLADDAAMIRVFIGGRFVERSVGQLAVSGVDG